MDVTINGYQFKVEFVDANSKKMNPDENRWNLGLFECVDGIISIREGMNQRTTRTIVIHELTHAFIFAFGYALDGEESVCDFWGAQGDAVIHMADLIMKEVSDQKCSET